MQCREVETKATEAIAKLKTLHQAMQQNEAKTAERAKEEIEGKDADVINSAMFAAENGKGGLKSTIQALMKTLPDESQRSTAVQEAASALAMPQAQPDMSVESLAGLLKTVDPKLDLLITKPFTCYVRILEVIGLIVKGCKSGTGSFDSIYQQTTSQANINNDQCSTDAMVQLPSKADIQETVQKVAAILKFNPDCSSNKQRDSARGRKGKAHKLRLKFQDDTSKEEEEKPSLSQRWTICKLLEKGVTEIAKLTGIPEDKIKDIDCKALMNDRDEL
ncbi:uncharacterized protein LOC110238735 [Exaiptasia diaphana]|uniref:Uncharacterized protein n=1 Tax=Exaiptasia diaphana TaxID=2652724 RepID=A0A913X7A5_EXADI|nr:uncharacterized protein LOC110238735 [Exaiptasia diaphana]KXJ26941.1 hypothetical protein AC249_AIPGENE16412 [Exaiptasia diaphana]